jgi:hypothetical protein
MTIARIFITRSRVKSENMSKKAYQWQWRMAWRKRRRQSMTKKKASEEIRRENQ